MRFRRSTSDWCVRTLGVSWGVRCAINKAAGSYRCGPIPLQSDAHVNLGQATAHMAVPVSFTTVRRYKYSFRLDEVIVVEIGA